MARLAAWAERAQHTIKMAVNVGSILMDMFYNSFVLRLAKKDPKHYLYTALMLVPYNLTQLVSKITNLVPECSTTYSDRLSVDDYVYKAFAFWLKESRVGDALPESMLNYLGRTIFRF